jgi:hypothetical protein
VLRTAARRAANPGVEGTVVDAGWYLGSPLPDGVPGKPSRDSSEQVEDDEDPTYLATRIWAVMRASWGGDRRNGGKIGLLSRVDEWGTAEQRAVSNGLQQWKEQIRGHA